MKEINLKTILEEVVVESFKQTISANASILSYNVVESYLRSQSAKLALSAMREAIKQSLELAAENAKVITTSDAPYKGDVVSSKAKYQNSLAQMTFIEVHKQSIIDTINQVK